MNIAIIPARSGSKGLFDKNIKKLNGKPMLAYSIEAALQSGCFDTVMVSTDSVQYADISRSYGAEVPFLRGEELARDNASTRDVVIDVIKRYESIGRSFDSLCILQPTSPLRLSEDIRDAYDVYNDKKAIAVMSVTELEHPLAWCGKLGEDNSLIGFNTRDNDKPRQEQDVYYRPNGAIYIMDVNEYMIDGFMLREGCYAYIMPIERSVDIDTELDFRLAEFLMRNTSNV